MAANLESTLGDSLQSAFGTAINPAVGQLGDIISRGGQISPQLMNFQLGDIERGTQSMVDALPSGPMDQNSGVVQALRSAILTGGESARQRAIATETNAAQERLFKALAQAFGMFEPALGYQGQKQSGEMLQRQLYAGLINSLAGGAGGFFSGDLAAELFT